MRNFHIITLALFLALSGCPKSPEPAPVKDFMEEFKQEQKRRMEAEAKRDSEEVSKGKWK